MASDRTAAIDAAFALVGGLVSSSLLLVLSLVYGWFPRAGSVGQFQAMLLGSLLVGGIAIAVPLYVAFDRWGLMRG